MPTVRNVKEAREQILKCLDSTPRPSSEISQLLYNRGLLISARKVGNNLKKLNGDGYVDMEEKGGKVHWKRNDMTDHYIEELEVPMMIKVPERINEGLTKLSKQLKMTKKELVVQAVEEQYGI